MADPTPQAAQGMVRVYGADAAHPPGERPPLADHAPEPNLLATKLYLPRTRPDLVARPRLYQRMNAGLDGALTLVCAPAGFGKSTLVAEWLRRMGRRAAWLSLDAADGDPAVFLRYLAAALQRLDAGVGTALFSFLQLAQLPPLETVMTVLINDLADVPDDIILVLDDYHMLQATAIHQAMRFFVERLPPSFHLVIITREDPPFPLSRLRARRQVVELRAEQLRFTTDEAATFLTDSMGLVLNSGDVAALEARTEGWIAGLQLAALAMQDRDDYADFIASLTGSNRFIVDYLTDEVLSRQPAHLQTFLLWTSMLDRLCAPLCDAVLGLEHGDWSMENTTAQSDRSLSAIQSSQAILEQLERANLFVSPLDAERRWYRYHHLFAEVLGERLRRDASAAAIAALHRRASAWYAQHGWVSEAIRHALAAESPDVAAALIETHGHTLIARGELLALTRWLRLLPDTTLRARPRLLVLLAWVLPNTGALEDVARYRAEAEALLADTPDPVLHSEFRALQLQPLIFQDRTDEVIAIGMQVLEHLPVEHFFHSVSGIITGIAFLRQSRLAEAEHVLSAAVAEARSRQSLFFLVSGLARLAIVAVERGDFVQAERHYTEALAACRGTGARLSPIAGMALVGLGCLRALQGRSDDAFHDLEQGLELCTQLNAAPFFFLDGHTGMADLLAAQGRFAEALDQLALAEERLRRFANPVFMDALIAYRAGVWRSQGNQAFQAWLDDRRRLLEAPLTAVRDKEYSVLLRGLIDTNQVSAALRGIDRLENFADSAGRVRSTIDLLVLRALALQQQGELQRAQAALSRAVELAAPIGYLSVFLESGMPMAALLEVQHTQLKGQNNAVQSFVEHLLAAIPSERGSIVGSTDTPPVLRMLPERSHILLEPLTPRELEVLGLIAAGASNGEIARSLVVSLGTVKKHTANIFGKLQVQSRTQAVARARELGLL